MSIVLPTVSKVYCAKIFVTIVLNFETVIFFVSPKKTRRAPIKKNPLKNSQVMIRLNPYWQTFKRQQYLIQQRRLKAKEAVAAAKK